MFESGNFIEKIIANGSFSQSFWSVYFPLSIMFGFYSFLKFERNICFVSLHNKIWANFLEKFSRSYAAKYPGKLRSVFSVSFAVVVDVAASAKLFLKSMDDGFMRHPDHKIEIVSDVGAIGFFPSIDADTSFSIEQSGGVSNIHNYSCVTAEKLVNSVELRCPAREGAEGQYRAKQGLKALGVCNEQVPTAKAKVCSELHRNMQTLAEMINAALYFITYKVHKLVTDCNTNYIFFRPHAQRNMVPIGDERFSVNQDAMVRLIGFAGNMTVSNRSLQGVLTVS